MSTDDSTPKRWSVYFIQIGLLGPIKIGRSRNPGRRLVALSAQMPFDMRIVGVIANVKPNTETRLHHRFASEHIRGEWFQPSPRLLRFIDSHAEPPEAEEFASVPQGLEDFDVPLLQKPGRDYRIPARQEEQGRVYNQLRDLMWYRLWKSGMTPRRIGEYAGVTKHHVSYCLRRLCDKAGLSEEPM